MCYSDSLRALYPDDDGWATLTCPSCGSQCRRDPTATGNGPFGCAACGWSENPDYDMRNGRDPVQYDGAVIDQWGAVFAHTTPVAKMVVAARAKAREDGTPWPPRPRPSTS